MVLVRANRLPISSGVIAQRNRASIASTLVACGSSVSSTDRYRYGLCSFARAVSIRLNTLALAVAPLGVSLNKKFLRAMAMVLERIYRAAPPVYFPRRAIGGVAGADRSGDGQICP